MIHMQSGWDKEARVMAPMSHSMVPDLLKSYDSLRHAQAVLTQVEIEAQRYLGVIDM